jgi:hypothetical protein
MDRIIEQLKDLAGPETVASETQRETARQRLQAAIADGSQQSTTVIAEQPAANVASITSLRRRRVRKWGVAVVGIAASIAVITMMLPNNASRDHGNYVASSPVGALFTSVADAAALGPSSIEPVWYTKIRFERYYADDGTKYGKWSAAPQIETHEYWSGANGLGQYDNVKTYEPGEVTPEGIETSNASDAAKADWDDSMRLPENENKLYAHFEKEAHKYVKGLQGEKPADPIAVEQEQLMRSVVSTLQLGALKPATRAGLYRVLARLADQGLIKDEGPLTDQQGRTGQAFSFTFQGDRDGVIRRVEVFDLKTGAFLEEQEFVGNRLDERQTYVSTGFVNELGARP